MESKSNSSQKTFLYFVVILLAIGVGYIATHLPSQDKKNNLSTEIVVKDTSVLDEEAATENAPEEKELTPEEKQQLKKIDDADHTFTLAHVGSLYKTKKTTLEYLQNGWATAQFPMSYKNKIMPNQKVILHDIKGERLPLGGIIRRVRAYTGGEENAVLEALITLPPDTKTDLLSNDAEIIFYENKYSRRFPLSALQKDKNNNHFVWVAKPTESEDKFTAEKTWLDKVTIGDNAFSTGLKYQQDRRIILSPNKKLKAEKVYDMALSQYTAPRGNPIEHAYEQYLIFLREKLAADLKCKPKFGVADDKAIGISESCSSNLIQPKTEINPLDIFNSILKRQPGGTGGGGACGGGGGSCGGGGAGGDLGSCGQGCGG